VRPRTMCWSDPQMFVARGRMMTEWLPCNLGYSISRTSTTPGFTYTTARLPLPWVPVRDKSTFAWEHPLWQICTEELDEIPRDEENDELVDSVLIKLWLQRGEQTCTFDTPENARLEVATSAFLVALTDKKDFEVFDNILIQL
jgi:hypothetical protein